MKPFKSLLLFICFSSIILAAQAHVSPESWQMKKFKEATHLYIIKDNESTREYSTSTNEKFTFIGELQKIWKDKKLVVIGVDEYNDLPKVNTLFYITLTSITSTLNSRTYKSTGILISKGKWVSEIDPSNTAAWWPVNLEDCHNGYLCERLKYNIAQLYYACTEPVTEDTFHVMLRTPECTTKLSKRTLVFRSDMLSEEDFKTVADLKKLYPYPVKIVDQKEWEKIITTKDPEYIVSDFVQGSCTLFYAETGELVLQVNSIRVPVNETGFKNLMKQLEK